MHPISTLLIAIAVVVSAPLAAQHPASSSFKIPLGGVNDGREHPDPNVSVRRVEQPAQEPTGLAVIKDSLFDKYHDKQSTTSNQRSAVTLPAPVVGSNFTANAFNNGTPTDNEVAIGNNGLLLSVQNSNIFRYNTAT
ncbi:MAG TPA: hypothetical protein VK826_00540, partial [Bacteroidia bacterium]|nr:hypothetical protein [Bacteroidia bacterium]